MTGTMNISVQIRRLCSILEMIVSIEGQASCGESSRERKNMNIDGYQEILSLVIDVNASMEVKGHRFSVAMLPFSGYAEGKIFNGKILAGGVDTQKIDSRSHTLSARYMLEGTDSAGKQCRIFIENNAKVSPSGEIDHTTPLICTDSEELAWLEDVPVVGKLTPRGGGIIIHLYANLRRS